MARRAVSVDSLKASDTFARRHNSNGDKEVNEMVAATGFSSLDALIDAMASKNEVFKSYQGTGYYGTHVPPVILRNVLENPGWYTQYTPYQAEIAQGRLESLLNFQTMICDLTRMPMSNASLLDEATASAEAMTMCSAINRGKKPKFYVASNCHPQTIAVTQSRADGLGLEVVVADPADFDYSGNDVCGVMVQYPATDGSIADYSSFVEKAHASNVKVCVSTDLLALTKLKAPGEFGADIVVGSAQRFGVPMGYGGPHAAFLATSEEYKRLMPGRVIGVSIDAQGKRALRMAMQTREQHIRRDKATSNICTAQALLANMASLYAVYHGPEGLTTIADRVNGLAQVFAAGAGKLGLKVNDAPFFDTVRVNVGDAAKVVAAAEAAGINIRQLDAECITVSMDETTSLEDLDALFAVLGGGSAPFTAESLASSVSVDVGPMARTTEILQQPIFNQFHSEHEMLRYLKRLENRDLSLCHCMISLGSCTMKLNATAEMMPITLPEMANMHPYAPVDQAEGYNIMLKELGDMLCDITGFDACSLQPNSGAAGEYAGLMAIRAYHQNNGDHDRNICIIPTSAHGTI